MRTVLYWSVKRDPYAGNFTVFRVTRVTSSRIYGSVGAISSHTIPACLYGKFETEGEAMAACSLVRRAWLAHDDDIRQAEAAINYLKSERGKAVQSVLDSLLRPAVVWPSPTEKNHATI